VRARHGGEIVRLSWFMLENGGFQSSERRYVVIVFVLDHQAFSWGLTLSDPFKPP
jgi:hypothetical protein